MKLTHSVFHFILTHICMKLTDIVLNAGVSISKLKNNDCYHIRTLHIFTVTCVHANLLEYMSTRQSILHDILRCAGFVHHLTHDFADFN